VRNSCFKILDGHTQNYRQSLHWQAVNLPITH
jgi:hypothetical protein